MSDKFSATWVSHSSMRDYINCPRAYYLNNVYKDPQTNHKITVMKPALALGQAVHEVLESLSKLPTADRLEDSLIEKFQVAWEKISGKKGGFTNPQTELEYKTRGEDMLRKVMRNPGPIARRAVKINQDLPHYWLSEEDQIILCGKVDWLEYLEATDSVHIIDFKSGKSQEDKASLQLPIYLLLVQNCQKRQVDAASYWYLESNNELTPKELPDPEEAREQVLKQAKQVKLARKLKKFECRQGGNCFACRDLETIFSGQGELVGVNDYKQDVYIIPSEPEDDQPDSQIL